MSQIESKVCGCGRGHKSQYDGKCGHCRTKKETKARENQWYHENRMNQALRELQAKIDRISSQ